MTEIEEKLLALAAEEANLEPTEVLSLIARPEWDGRQYVYGWCQYVPAELEAIWPNMSDEAKLAVYFVAEGRAEAGRLNWEP